MYLYICIYMLDIYVSFYAMPSSSCSSSSSRRQPHVSIRYCICSWHTAAVPGSCCCCCQFVGVFVLLLHDVNRKCVQLLFVAAVRSFIRSWWSKATLGIEKRWASLAVRCFRFLLFLGSNCLHFYSCVCCTI